jgi:hypothetical protein
VDEKENGRGKQVQQYIVVPVPGPLSGDESGSYPFFE